MELRSQRKNPFSSSKDEESAPEDEPARKKRKHMDGINPCLDDDSTVVPINSTPQLESLPIELLHMIFSYLSTCDKVSLQMVCRRLRFVLDDPDHWRCVVIPPYISAKDPKYVQSVLKHTELHVRSLSLVGCPSTSITSSYLNSCTSLTALDLYGSDITNSAMKELLLRLPNLSRLSISEGTAQAVLPILPSLQQLVITMHPISANHKPAVHDIYEHLSYNFSRLHSQLVEENSLAKPSNLAIRHIDIPFKQFGLYRFGKVSEYRGLALSTANMLQTVMPIPSFVSKNSTEMGFHIPGIPDVNNKPILIIVSTAVSSSVLSANINYTHAFVADSSSARVPTICPSFEVIAANITSLDLKDITLQSLDDVRNIVKFTPNLLYISLNGVRLSNYSNPLDMLFIALSVYCPKLTSIFFFVFGHFMQQSECYVENACELWNNIVSLKRLEHLSVCSCLFQESPPVSNDHQHEHLYPNLKLLPISFQSLIVDIHQTKRVQVVNLDTIIANICNIQHLRMLRLHMSWFGRQDESTEPLILNLQQLLESCTKLEELLVAPRGNVQIVSSPAVSQLKCIKLTPNKNSNISIPESFSTDLVPIGQKNMNLQVLLLHVDSCLWHDSEVIRILEHCPSLVSLGLPCHPGSAFEAGAKDITKKYNLLKFFSTCHRSDPNSMEFMSVSS